MKYLFSLLLLFFIFNFASSTCMEKRLDIQANNARIGVFIPRCDEMNGDFYKPLQCHGSTGYCWCVEVESGEQKGESFLLWEVDPSIDLETLC